ncbi:MAG: hypothetical protein Q4E52_00680 [Fibrobacter sp.]|nr:hypothetical protein [Fibrobacter sp.]
MQTDNAVFPAQKQGELDKNKKFIILAAAGILAACGAAALQFQHPIRQRNLQCIRRQVLRPMGKPYRKCRSKVPSGTWTETGFVVYDGIMEEVFEDYIPHEINTISITENTITFSSPQNPDWDFYKNELEAASTEPSTPSRTSIYTEE